MRSIIIWSTNSLEENYNNILFVRTTLLKSGWEIQDDWINTRIQVKNNIPHFLEVQDYDYLKVGIDGILNSELVIVFFTKESSYITTLIKYANYNLKKIIVIYKTKEILKNLDIDLTNIKFLSIKSIAKFSENIN